MASSTVRHLLFPLLLTTLLAACGEPGQIGTPPDAGSTPDASDGAPGPDGARPADAAGDDGGPTVDLTPDRDGSVPGDDQAPPADVVTADAPGPDQAPDLPPAELPACPTFDDAATLGEVTSNQISETSGIVASRRQSGVLWIHNDSGDTPRVFAIDAEGRLLGTFNVEGARAADWEDIAIGPGPDASRDYLYIGDIGNNPGTRPSAIIYRIPEPAVSVGQQPVTLTVSDPEAFTVHYPDGASFNAETLLVDPLSGDFFIVRKASSGTSGVYRKAAPHTDGSDSILEEIASLQFGAEPLPGNETTTGGDISADGREILVRTYGSAFIWRRLPGASMAQAFTTAPCPVAIRNGGEAVAFAPDGSGYYAINEGATPALFFHARQ